MKGNSDVFSGVVAGGGRVYWPPRFESVGEGGN